MFPKQFQCLGERNCQVGDISRGVRNQLRVCSVISVSYGLDEIRKKMKDFDLFGI
jgi:hypothetical protein